MKPNELKPYKILNIIFFIINFKADTTNVWSVAAIRIKINNSQSLISLYMHKNVQFSTEKKAHTILDYYPSHNT